MRKKNLKIRFIEPGNRPYRPSLLNYFVYDRYIRTPSVGLNTLATIVHQEYEDTYMYSESICKLKMNDILDADIIFIGIFTFAAVRGYELARLFRENSRATIVMGGLHASMNYAEAACIVTMYYWEKEMRQSFRLFDTLRKGWNRILQEWRIGIMVS